MPHISGLLLLGSNHDDRFITSPAVTGKGRRFPVYLGHGTADPIYGWKDEVTFYNKVRAADPNYPIKVRDLQHRRPRHADPHDRLAADPELDARGGRALTARLRSGHAGLFNRLDRAAHRQAQ